MAAMNDGGVCALVEIVMVTIKPPIYPNNTTYILMV